MIERGTLQVVGAEHVLQGTTLARYLRARGLSCRGVAAPGALARWGAIYLAEPTDLMRVRILLEDHPRVTDLAESRDRISDVWPLWYRVNSTTDNRG